MGSSRKACARAGALPSDQFTQLPITPLANFDRPGEIGIIAQTPPQPHIGCIAVALSHLHGSEEVVVAIIDRRVAITDAAPPLQDQVAVIKAADIGGELVDHALLAAAELLVPLLEGSTWRLALFNLIAVWVG